MTLWKAERASSTLFSLNVPARHLDLAALVIIAAAPAVVLIWLIPLPLVLPVLSIVSFAIAGVAAVAAHCCGIDRRAPGVSAWDIAAVFTLIWIGAGMMGGSKHFIELFDRLAIVP